MFVLMGRENTHFDKFLRELNDKICEKVFGKHIGYQNQAEIT